MTTQGDLLEGIDVISLSPDGVSTQVIKRDIPAVHLAPLGVHEEPVVDPGSEHAQKPHMRLSLASGKRQLVLPQSEALTTESIELFADISRRREGGNNVVVRHAAV